MNGSEQKQEATDELNIGPEFASRRAGLDMAHDAACLADVVQMLKINRQKVKTGDLERDSDMDEEGDTRIHVGDTHIHGTVQDVGQAVPPVSSYSEIITRNPPSPPEPPPPETPRSKASYAPYLLAALTALAGAGGGAAIFDHLRQPEPQVTTDTDTRNTVRPVP